MPTGRQRSSDLRVQLVADLERRKAIRSEPVREAFLAVPRELFVAEFAAREGLDAVYRDEAIPTKRHPQGFPLSSSSQPTIMALMLEQLELEKGMRVLEVGAGTGYNAALLSLLVGERGRVVSIDIDPQIAAQARRTLKATNHRVRVVHADGRSGYPQSAPFDRIIVTGSTETIPLAWHEQLADHGLLQVPLRLTAAGMQAIPVLRKTLRGFRSQHVLRGGFMALHGADDDGIPPRPREPILNVTQIGPEGSTPVLQLSGVALATLSAAATRRLLATAVGNPRTRALGVRADNTALSLYLSLTIPRSRLVSFHAPVSNPSKYFRAPGLGAISRDGRGVAVIEGAHTGRTRVDALKQYGSREAADLLITYVREWADRGRPTESDCAITVTYDGEQSRTSVRWPPITKAARPDAAR
jgi:protein-L-isoaspartate(D-aspartate) O-methyltransferase